MDLTKLIVTFRKSANAPKSVLNKCLVSGNYFRSLTNDKEVIDKKKTSYHLYVKETTLKSTILPQMVAKGSTRNMLAFLGLRLKKDCCSLTLAFFVKNNFVISN